MPDVVLITGAAAGLGRETARRLREAGHTVIVTARDPAAGKAVADELDAEFGPLDVTDEASVTTAAATVGARFGHLDVLVNNAGVVGPRDPLPEITAEQVLATLDANVLGVVRVTRAFLPLLRAAEQPRIVNVSSGTGRLTWQQANGWPQEKAPPIYSMSKAAVTMLTLQYAQSLPGIQVNAAWPGYTATALNDHQGTQTVTEGTDAIVALATLPPDGPTGTMRNRDGAVDPW